MAAVSAPSFGSPLLPGQELSPKITFPPSSVICPAVQLRGWAGPAVLDAMIESASVIVPKSLRTPPVLCTAELLVTVTKLIWSSPSKCQTAPPSPPVPVPPGPVPPADAVLPLIVSLVRVADELESA